jgi:hypothetical protein
MAEKTAVRRVTIAGQRFVLKRGDVVRAVRGVDPEPITSHYVVVGSHRFPPKQVIGELTGLDRADFTSHQARRTLVRLGFTAGRRGGRPGSTRPGTKAASEQFSDRLRDHTGEWVAIKNGDVLHASSTPKALVAWLSRHGQKADSVFRVPEDELAASGLAPL